MNEVSLDPSVLDLEIEDDCFRGTVREFFKGLALQVWSDHGKYKRVLGNSDWPYILYKALIEAGVIEGTLDQYGYVAKCDLTDADRQITELVEEHM